MTGTAAAQHLLGLEMPANDSGATTVRGYLKALLTTLWQEEEGFSGKRPFGNSSWQYDIYLVMAKAGLIEGVTLDDDGDFDYNGPWSEWNVKLKQADQLILAAIASL